MVKNGKKARVEILKIPFNNASKSYSCDEYGYSEQ